MANCVPRGGEVDVEPGDQKDQNDDSDSKADYGWKGKDPFP